MRRFWNSQASSHRNRCAGSRCTRDQREELEETDVKCGLVTDLGYFLYAEFRVLVAVLEGNKNNTVDDEHRRYHIWIIEILVKHFVKQDSDHGSRKAGDDDLKP